MTKLQERTMASTGYVLPGSDYPERSHYFEIHRFNADRLEEMKQRHRDASSRVGVFLDLDETCVETVERHVALLNMHAQGFGMAPEALPTYEAVLHLRGTQHAYKGVFPNLHTEAEFQKFMEQVRRTSFVNHGAPPLHPNLAEQITSELRKGNAHLIGAITARIGSRRVVDTTYTDLFDRLGIPEMPIMFRPDDIAEKDTGQWKLDNMLAVASERPDGLAVLFDDSASTATKIMSYNETRIHGQMPMIDILFEGSLTQSFLNEHSVDERGAWKKKGVYVGNWNNLGAVLSEVESQWLQTQN